MKQSLVVATDILLKQIKDNKLEDYFCNYRKKGTKLYITIGVRNSVEENLDNDTQTQTWHRLLNEGISQGLIVKSRHKYQLEHDYKILYRHLRTIGDKLTDVEKEVIALSLQEGFEVDTGNPSIVKVLHHIELTPHLQKYARKLISHRFPKEEEMLE